jgi:hypothetical protein
VRRVNVLSESVVMVESAAAHAIGNDRRADAQWKQGA